MTGKPILNPLAVKGRKKLYEKMWRDFLHREEKIAGHALKSVAHMVFSYDSTRLTYIF